MPEKQTTKKKSPKKPAQSMEAVVAEARKNAQPEMVEAELESVDEDQEQQTQPDGNFCHRVNVRWPWLKIVLLVLLVIAVAFGVEELLRRSINHPAPTEAATVEETPVEPETQVEETTISDQPLEEKPAEPEAEATATTVSATQSQVPVKKPTVTGRKLVALTFDDGPSATQTPRLLQILREKGVKATFFVVGNMAQKSPDLLLQEASDGHEVGSHTMTHANLQKSTVDGIKWEVAAINEVFQNTLGKLPRITRPPYGAVSQNARTYVNQPLILWTVDPEDWKYRNATTVYQNVVGAVFDGAIVLMHDVHATTVDAVSRIIDELRAQGYEFLTVSELAAVRGITLQNGVTYGSFRP